MIYLTADVLLCLLLNPTRDMFGAVFLYVQQVSVHLLKTVYVAAERLKNVHLSLGEGEREE